MTGDEDRQRAVTLAQHAVQAVVEQHGVSARQASRIAEKAVLEALRALAQGNVGDPTLIGGGMVQDPFADSDVLLDLDRAVLISSVICARVQPVSTDHSEPLYALQLAGTSNGAGDVTGLFLTGLDGYAAIITEALRCARAAGAAEDLADLIDRRTLPEDR